ncbi:hypothetical protein GCM10011390_34800 [Aureimonas endophytica]|uniref:Uncharacterized protein n=1 Tax=Aureimonas endophytica TaxID=2027858 RepID=A0A917E7J4_9HYPH|nr:hypothetical protein [Aureimonas endophytica]GGE12657.1 hypothetical protein GCM10011390_34800 [Aureimonas endophytica]
MPKLSLPVAMVAALLLAPASRADDYPVVAGFSRSVCEDITSGLLTRTRIKEAVEARVGVLAAMVNGGEAVSESFVRQLYSGIPFDKLPDYMPSALSCKFELASVISQRRKIVENSCENEAFGQIGWRLSEDVTEASGDLDHRGDEEWWCNKMTSDFLAARRIAEPYRIDRLGAAETSAKDATGATRFRYSCSARVSWAPRYNVRRDATLCGVHEEQASDAGR